MKLYATLFALAAVAFAEGEENEEADGTWEDIKSWASSKQEPVEFDSILTPNPCMLKGTYGWFQRLGVSAVFIRQTVWGCDIADGAKVLTYGAYNDPDDADGPQEAYYCTVEYKQDQETASQSQIYVKTMDTKEGSANLA